MSRFSSIDHLRDSIGEEFGPIDWIEISQAQINEFAKLTKDEQWIHVDEERAKSSPLGTTVAHGYFVLALVAPAVMGLMTIDNARTYLNYGMNKVRFPSSVPAGSRIRAKLRLLDVADHGQGILFTVEAAVGVEHQSKPACVAEVVTYVEFD